MEVQRRTIELEQSNRQLANANEQLKINDKLQKEFINIAAHELRTPIQPILGISELIHHQFNTSRKDKIEISKPEMDLIIRNANRLERLSATLLQVARIDSQTLKLEKTIFDINEKIITLIADTHASLAKKSDSNNYSRSSTISLSEDLKLLFEAKNSPINVYVDSERIAEVISNLIGNAIKFTVSGSIVVTSEIEDEFAIITVSDTGKGIDPEILPNLFVKFVTKSDIGTGLGLYISKGIVEAHGGKIWAENNKDERGTTFRFSLPISEKKTKLMVLKNFKWGENLAWFASRCKT